MMGKGVHCSSHFFTMSQFFFYIWEMAGTVFDFRHTVVARWRADNVANHLPYLYLIGAALWIRITLMRIRTLMWIRLLIIFDADPDSDFFVDAEADPEPTFHPEADPDPDPDPRFQMKAQTPEKVLK
jgi:hypothetical protein